MLGQVHNVSSCLLIYLAEAAHIALMLYKHGYFFSVDRDDSIVKEDNTLFRFQVRLNGWIDGWMDRWMDGWMDELMDG